jgi:hypothetical protein
MFLNDLCMLCSEYVMSNDEQARGIWLDEYGEHRKVHRECALRNVIGGIGHIEDHDKWCLVHRDPDMGLGFRKSAQLVDEWVRAHGVPL